MGRFGRAWLVFRILKAYYQVARYLVKCCRQGTKEAWPKSVFYLRRKETKPTLDLATPYGLSTLFEKVARGQIYEAIDRLDQCQKPPEGAHVTHAYVCKQTAVFKKCNLPFFSKNCSFFFKNISN